MGCATWKRSALGRLGDSPRSNLPTSVADAVFVEDTLVVVFDDLAVVDAAWGADAGAGRRTLGAEQAARRLGLEVQTIEEGDARRWRRAQGRPDRVRRGQRAHRSGGDRAARDRSCPAGLGAVRPVEVRSVLHLKSAVTALPDGTVIGYPDLVDDDSVFDRFLPVPEPGGAHVVLLGDDRLADVGLGTPHRPSCSRDLGYSADRGRHLRVREARGLRDVPVGSRERPSSR